MKQTNKQTKNTEINSLSWSNINYHISLDVVDKFSFNSAFSGGNL